MSYTPDYKIKMGYIINMNIIGIIIVVLQPKPTSRRKLLEERPAESLVNDTVSQVVSGFMPHTSESLSSITGACSALTFLPLNNVYNNSMSVKVFVFHYCTFPSLNMFTIRVCFCVILCVIMLSAYVKEW